MIRDGLREQCRDRCRQWGVNVGGLYIDITTPSDKRLTKTKTICAVACYVVEST